VKNDDSSHKSKFDEGGRVDCDQADQAEEKAKQKSERESDGTEQGAGEKRTLPPSLSFNDFNQKEIPEPKTLINGILTVGAKMSINGPSKAGKSFLLVDLAVSVANGVEWLGKRVAPGKVFYVNFELRKHYFRERLRKILATKGVKQHQPNLRVWNLRGYYPTVTDFAEALLAEIGTEQYDIIIIDPFYKLLLGARENDPGDMAKVLAVFEEIAEKSGASLIYAGHFSKGDQTKKEAQDRISGSGVLARDPDVIFTMTSCKGHRSEDICYAVEIGLRDFKAPGKFVIRWDPDACLFKPDEALDPEELKKPGSEKKFSEEMLLAELGDEELTTKDWEKRCMTEYGMSGRTFHNLMANLRKAKKIEKSNLTKRWSKTVSEFNREKGYK